VKHDDGCGCHDHDHDHDSHHDHDHDHSGPVDELTSRNDASYSGNGVQFFYPDGWEVQKESNDEQIMITVQSPATASWSLSLFEGHHDPEEIAETVLRAFREMYDDMEVQEPVVLVQGIPVVAREIDFVCMELVSTASLIVFHTATQSVLVIFQAEDREMERVRPLMEAITQSLSCDVE